MVKITHEVKLIDYSVVCESESFAKGILIFDPATEPIDTLHVTTNKLWENLLITVAFAEGPIYEKVAMDHNGIVTVPSRVLQHITPANRLGKIIFTGTAPNIRRITVDLPYRVLGPSGDIDSSKLYAQWPIFNAQTHYDFPSIGYPNVIYKAESEHMLYQWIDSENRYDPLTTGSGIDNVTLINGGDAYGNA